MSDDLSTASIAQIAIVVQDVEAATRYYRDILGFKFVFEFPGLAFFQCGEVRLMLSRPEKPEHTGEDAHRSYKKNTLNRTNSCYKPNVVARKTAAWPRVTGLLGQNWPLPHPPVIPRRASSSIHGA